MITDKIMEQVVKGTAVSWCPQCHTAVKNEDYVPEAGMCGACVNEAMAEASEWFGRKGLVPSAEEQESND